MYETVKVVKNHEIKRMIGTHGAYHVAITKANGVESFLTFRTIKAAAEFLKAM